MLRCVRPIGLGLFSLLVLLALLYSTYSDVSRNLSPQGCRMSWMSPSYVLQSQFNSSQTPLGGRYSLWLYREVGWDVNQVRSFILCTMMFLYQRKTSIDFKGEHASPVHSRKCWVVSPDTLNRILRHSTILFFPPCRFT